MQNIFTDFEHPTPKHPKVSKKVGLLTLPFKLTYLAK